MRNEQELFEAGLAHHQLGHWPQAEQLYRQLLILQPGHAGAQHLMGVLAIQHEQYAAAIDWIQRAIATTPSIAEFHCNLGVAQEKSGQLEAARASFYRALALRPEYAEALNNLGMLLTSQGRGDDALAYLQRAIQMRPNYPDALSNLGNALRDTGRFDEAVACYQRALQLQPGFADAYNNLGSAFERQGMREAAIDCYRQLHQLRPRSGKAAALLLHQLQYTCDWEDQERLASQVIQAIEGDDAIDRTDLIFPFTVVGLPIATTAKQQFQAATKWIRGTIAPAAREVRRASSARTAARSRIRVGYLSADFTIHPVSYLIVEMLEQHARDRFEIFGYALNRNDSTALGNRITKAFDCFRDIANLSIPHAVERIAADDVDILVDLQGHTQHARTEILARRPARIQVNYLGYAGTMGADFIDYILVDDFVVPADQQPFFSEKLVHLPGCFMVHDQHRQVDDQRLSRKTAGLPEQGFVFCAFSAAFKINQRLFDVWLNLLAMVPESVLWLRVDQPRAISNLIRRALERGIAPERLVFAPVVAMPTHLARQRLADLFLDTFPYNQHSTAGDALRMGLPLVTLAGQTFASRVAGSLLQALHLPELITYRLDEYETKSLHLARNPGELAKVRDKLAQALSATRVFDGTAFARNVEQAYRTMWQIEQRGEPPRRIAIREPD